MLLCVVLTGKKRKKGRILAVSFQRCGMPTGRDGAQERDGPTYLVASEEDPQTALNAAVRQVMLEATELANCLHNRNLCTNRNHYCGIMP